MFEVCLFYTKYNYCETGLEYKLQYREPIMFQKTADPEQEADKVHQVFISSDASNIHQSQSDIQLFEELVQAAGCAAKTPTADL